MRNGARSRCLPPGRPLRGNVPSLEVEMSNGFSYVVALLASAVLFGWESALIAYAGTLAFRVAWFFAVGSDPGGDDV